MALPLTRVSGLTQPCSLTALPRTGLLCSRSSSGLIAAGQRTSLGAALRMHMTPRGLQGEELEPMDGLSIPDPLAMHSSTPWRRSAGTHFQSRC